MKKKIFKYILITILVIILCLIILVGKKMTIISKLDKRVRYYEDNKDNIYMKVVDKTVIDEEDEEIQSTAEIFLKGDVYKSVVETDTKNGEISKSIQMLYPTERKEFSETGANKKLTVYSEEHVRSTDTRIAESTYTAIPNYAHYINFIELIKKALTTDIKFTQVNGKLCYELSSKTDSNEYTQACKYAYLEKDTGLPLRLVSESITDGKKVEYITDCEVKFDCVTDADIAEPNIAEYKLQEQ